MTEQNGNGKEPQKSGEDGKPELVIGDNAFRISIIYGQDRRVVIELGEVPPQLHGPREIIKLLELAAKAVHGQIQKKASSIIIPEGHIDLKKLKRF